MKKSIEITLSAIHLGSCREVATLAINGKDHASKFLNQLDKKDHNAYKTLQTRIRTVAEYDKYENEQTFRDLGKGIYEFKRNKPKLIRLYAFYDDIDGIGQLILCTNGGDKKLQSQGITKARAIRKKYFDAKEKSDTTLIYNELNP